MVLVLKDNKSVEENEEIIFNSIKRYLKKKDPFFRLIYNFELQLDPSDCIIFRVYKGNRLIVNELYYGEYGKYLSALRRFIIEKYPDYRRLNPNRYIRIKDPFSCPLCDSRRLIGNREITDTEVRFRCDCGVVIPYKIYER